MDKICGIYCIENTVNGKKYIGLSSNIYKRWKDHRKSLLENKHVNKHLQSSWNKYGEKAFNFYILETLNLGNKSVLKILEMYYIEIYQTQNVLYGYNKTSGGDGVRNLAQESRDKISEAETLYPVVKLSLKGEYISTFRNCHFAALDVNGRTENIRQCCNKAYGYKTAYGYIWMYAEEYNKTGCDLNDYKKKVTAKEVDVCLLDGTFVGVYSSARMVDKNLGIPYRNVSQLCNGQKRQSHGYICRFHGEPFDKYEILRKDGKIDPIR